MKCVFSKYGAYTSHLTALSEDPTESQLIKLSLKVIIGSGLLLSICLAVCC